MLNKLDKKECGKLITEPCREVEETQLAIVASPAAHSQNGQPPASLLRPLLASSASKETVEDAFPSLSDDDDFDYETPTKTLMFGVQNRGSLSFLVADAAILQIAHGAATLPAKKGVLDWQNRFLGPPICYPQMCYPQICISLICRFSLI